ncbi:PAS domain-containing sensor histidine kinase, partial [Nitrospirota bacterium]
AKQLRCEITRLRARMLELEDSPDHIKCDEQSLVKDYALESSMSAVALADLSGDLTYVNRAFLVMWGYYDASEVLGRPATGFWHHSEDPSAVIDALNRDGSWSGEMLAIRKDSSEFTAQLSAHLVKDPEGNPISLMSSFMDITERKCAEESLRESEERFRRIISDSPIGITVYDDSGQCIDANDSMGELIGTTREEVLEQNFHEIKSWKESGFYGKALKAIKERKTQQDEASFSTSSGKEVFVDCYFIPYGSNGLICMAKDISEKRDAEDELRKSKSSLDNAQRLAHLGSWDWDIETGELAWSDEIYRIFGFKPSRFMPSYDAFMNAVHLEDRASVQEAIDRALNDGQEYIVEHRVLRPDGSIRVVSELGEVITDGSGRPVSMHGTVLDITERKRAEQKLKEAHDSLEARVLERTSELENALSDLSEAHRVRDEFLANISHELRTPLNAIIGFSEIIINDFSKDISPEILTDIEQIHESGERLLELINELLDFTNIMAGKVVLHDAPVTLGELVSGAVNRNKTKALAKGIEVASSVDPDVPEEVLADPTLLTQVLVSLLDNAVKFTPQGTVTLRVERESSDKGGIVLRFSVRDTGIGINEAQLKNIFEHFTQADGSSVRRYGGMGLGLAISNSLVRMMGGRLDVSSSPGKGSEFSFTAWCGIYE